MTFWTKLVSLDQKSIFGPCLSKIARHSNHNFDISTQFVIFILIKTKNYMYLRLVMIKFFPSEKKNLKIIFPRTKNLVLCWILALIFQNNYIIARSFIKIATLSSRFEKKKKKMIDNSWVIQLRQFYAIFTSVIQIPSRFLANSCIGPSYDDCFSIEAYFAAARYINKPHGIKIRARLQREKLQILKHLLTLQKIQRTITFYTLVNMKFPFEITAKIHRTYRKKHKNFYYFNKLCRAEVGKLMRAVQPQHQDNNYNAAR